MDRLRSIFRTIQGQLGGLGPTQKLLIGSLCVIMLMTLFLVSQYAGRAEMVDLLPAASSEDQQRAIAVLGPRGLGVRDMNGVAKVPVENRYLAQAALSESGQAPADTTLMFKDIADKLSWTNARETNKAIYKTMLENELAKVIAAHSGVRSAKVILDIPEPTNIGQAVPMPKAAIALFSDSGGAIEQAVVDAAARLVAGAVSRLEVSRVTVTDGGRARRVTDDAHAAPTAAREAATLVERQFQEKIASLLRHIEGVVVEVTADVDLKRVASQETRYLKPNEGTVSVLRSEKTLSDTDTRLSQATEPGVRANVQRDITSGGEAGTRSAKEESESENEVKIGSRVSQITDPGGQPTRLVATVSVPRGYIADVLRRERPAGEGEPLAATDAEIRTRFDAEKQSIQEAVRPHLSTRTADGGEVPGEVVVALVAGDGAVASGPARVPGAAGSGGGPIGGGGIATILTYGGGIVDKVMLGALAVVALGMMFLMVRKAGKKVDLPTAEQLVGLPPALATKSDLVGEADESETPIEGIEVGEHEIKASKLREQVSELIKTSPEIAGNMLNRWVSTEE